MADDTGSPVIQDLEIDLGCEDLAQLDDLLNWDFSDNGFSLDDLIPCSEDYACDIGASADHANVKGFCSDFGEFEGSFVNNYSSSASRNNSSDAVDANSHGSQTPQGTALTDDCSVDNKEAQGSTHDLVIETRDYACDICASADHAIAKGFCSDFLEFEGLFVNNTSSSAFPNNSSDAVDANSHCAQTPKATALADGCSVDNKEAQGSTHGLVPETRAQDHENLESKRQLRIINNREAAFQSRQRRKSYIQGLESKCQKWENYCNQLQRSFAFVCAENTVLRDELSCCKRQKCSNGVSEPAVHKDSPPLESRSHLTTLVVAGHIISFHCLVWLLAALILQLLGGAVKLRSINSTSQVDYKYKFSIFMVSITSGEKRSVLESFPVTSSRALSSCRHRYWR